MNILLKIIFFIAISTKCFSQQCSINELIKLAQSAQYDDFETYALSKGFQLYKVMKPEFSDKTMTDGYQYNKNIGSENEWLIYFRVKESYGSESAGSLIVTYNTKNQKSYGLLKQQIKNLGYSLYKTSDNPTDNSVLSSYSSKNSEIIIQTTVDYDKETLSTSYSVSSVRNFKKKKSKNTPD